MTTAPKPVSVPPAERQGVVSSRRIPRESREQSPLNPEVASSETGGRPSPETGMVRGALALLSTQPLTWTASLLLAILLPHYLGGLALGEFTAAATVAGLAGLTVSLGVPSYLIRRLATRPGRASRDAGAALVFLLILALLTAVALFLASIPLSFPVPRTVLAIMLGGMVIAIGQDVLFSVLIGQERHARFAWLNAGGAALGAGAGLGVLALGGNLAEFVAVVTIAAGATFVLAWYSSGIRLKRPSFDPKLWWRLTCGGIPFLGWNLALRVYGETDKILLALLAPTAVVGWYGAAYRIIGIPVFIPTLITTPLYPALSRHAEDPRQFAQTLRRSVITVLILTVPISAMIVALAPSIPALLHWPHEFEHSVPLMMILAVHEPFVAVDMVLATGLAALKRERRWLCVGIVASILNPALNLLLIPIFQRWLGDGAIASAIVTVATELLTFAGALVLLPSGTITRGTAWKSARVLAAGACVWPVTATLRDTSLPLAIMAGLLTFTGMAAALRVILPADVSLVYKVSRDVIRSRLGGSSR